MKTRSLATTLLTLLIGMTSAAFAEKAEVRPYAAGSPSGGIPLWNPGEKFVAIASGTCSGNCPVYELYVFDDGRVIFVGRKNTGQQGVLRKTVTPDAYATLLTLIVRTRVLDGKLKRGTCLSGRPTITIMRSSPNDPNSMLMQLFNSGCEGYADLTRDIEKQFIDWTEVDQWIAGR